MVRLLLQRTLRSAVPTARRATTPVTAMIYLRSTDSPRFYSDPANLSVFRVSFWRGLVPKPFRRGQGADGAPADAATGQKVPWLRREWNPATFYILVGTAIASVAMQLIAVKNDLANFTRQSDVRIRLLREVIEKIQKGEKVEVERLLGTGDQAKEDDWEQAMKEIERENWARKQKQQQERLRRKQEDKSSSGTVAAKPATPPPKHTAFF